MMRFYLDEKEVLVTAGASFLVSRVVNVLAYTRVYLNVVDRSSVGERGS